MNVYIKHSGVEELPLRVFEPNDSLTITWTLESKQQVRVCIRYNSGRSRFSSFWLKTLYRLTWFLPKADDKLTINLEDLEKRS